MAIVLLLGAGIQLWHFARVVVAGLAGERVTARLRQCTFLAIFRQELAFFDAQTSGGLTSRLTSDTVMVNLAISSGSIESFIGFAKAAAAIVMAWYESWQLAALTLAVGPAMGLVLCLPLLWVHKIYVRYNDALARATHISTEAAGGVRTVISFGSEEFLQMLYGAAIGRIDGPGVTCWWPHKSHSTYRYGVQRGVALKVVLQVVIWLGLSLMHIVLWYGYDLILTGELTFGQVRCDGGEQPEPLQMSVRFDAVEFSYPSRPQVQVLQGLTFTVPANSMAAFVGASGAGKSTVLALLQRFYEVGGGRISLGGHELVDLDAGWLRRRIGVVQQEPLLFGITVRGNITYGRNARIFAEGGQPVAEDALLTASKMANVHGFVEELPLGYDTLVGERGAMLSGGQKQRIAVARALLMEPALLLLDEATSALDAATERSVQEAIDRSMTGRTTLVVAHRLSTVRGADQ
eukprot:CAMPEP_0175252614 /NCGR_PEP_ID=MMETSP0093-20121207/36262_1 /TAXON_ID=311494 /ORGANISM="Alexandrium monilatum, Strain CCMP3105" /LENGTH=462 /DNA_ID=CAMNT_0016546901 /DNA_START=33 /DNA_END=1418 /DNA_ORIENTATION=-